MKSSLLAVILAALPLCATAAPPSPAEVTRDASQYFKPCDGDEPRNVRACHAIQQQFLADYLGAFRGDYRDIRNIAGWLQFGTPYQNIIQQNPIQSCAWWIVVLLQPTHEETDRQHATLTCHPLDDAALAAAQIRAATLNAQITR